MATCCIPYAICPSVLKLSLATSVPYGNPAAPTTADRIVLGGEIQLSAINLRLRVYLPGRMEAFTIRRDDTNALLKFNFELSISESALQIDCNFLEGTASSLPACHVRDAPEQASPAPRSRKGMVQSRSPHPRKSLKSAPAPPPAGRGRPRREPARDVGGSVGGWSAAFEGWGDRRERPGEERQAGGRRERGLYYLGFSGGASSSQSRRRSFSFALRATHPGWLPARRRGGRRRGDQSPGRSARRSHPPLLPSSRPKQSPPTLSPGYVTCPALPAPRSPHPQLDARGTGPAPRGSQSGRPRLDRSPSLDILGRFLGQREHEK